MNIRFDPDADALYVALSEREIAETDEVGPGIILDYDKNGEMVGVEMLYVSRRDRCRVGRAEQAAP